MRGVYVFSQAKNAAEGAAEATFAINRLKALGIGPADLCLPVYMDYEFAGGILGRMRGISKTNATNAAVAFCNTVKDAGYTPGIYANTTFFGSYIATQQLASDVDLWCAQYNKRNQSGVNYSKWQYSSSARIDGMLSFTGLQGKIDANFWYINKNKASSSVVTKITRQNDPQQKGCKSSEVQGICREKTAHRRKGLHSRRYQKQDQRKRLRVYKRNRQLQRLCAYTYQDRKKEQRQHQETDQLR